MAERSEDREILALFRTHEGRESAYRRLVEKYQERLYWHIRRLVIDHEDAQDVLQNTLLRVWNGLDRFREDSRLYTWLYRIATNESLTHLEQRKRRDSVPLEEMTQWLEGKLTAEDGFDANRVEWKLQLAIQRLPEKQRIVFNLRYFDEMTYEEMSRILNTSVGGLKASYHHAARKVEQALLS